MRRRAWVLGLCCGISLLAGCGGSSSPTTVQLRIVQASPDAPHMNILIDGTNVATQLAYMNSTSYISVKTGSRKIEAQEVANSSAIFQQTISITSSSNQTLLLTGAASSIQPVLLIDGGTTSATGDGNVRVINASTTMPAADVYIVTAGTGIAGATPVTTSPLGFDASTGYKSAAIGNFEVFMTQTGTANVYLDTGSLALTQGQNQTVVALDEPSGGFTYIVLADQ